MRARVGAEGNETRALGTRGPSTLTAPADVAGLARVAQRSVTGRAPLVLASSTLTA